ncbi:tripartite tricarboxylate transporter TctB family protein [Virgibacillus necropolis]|uniref:DUF1468 domain-containing protein n=1 Tax=Virgibacillus necropolis TaxID=163877 RepID=A0A221M9T5_9BACI|nr:tripartite tricarboxylate transporter TctB family protein [Virgibacillus necropolis]ASN04389.1 hypothetical protein CFK40_04875 [Virgibacillus necropolis]
MQFVTIIFIYILSGYFYFEASGFRENAGIFPEMVSLILLVLNTIYLFQELKEKRKISKNNSGKSTIVKPTKQFYVITIASIGYVALLNVIGFLILTPMYLALIMFYLGGKRKKVIFPIVIVFTFAVYISFSSLLNISIPQGIIFNL